MANIAALSNKGPVRDTNQDACCVEVASTAHGEVVMAVICDGVGGLELGELASATVVARFSKWFEEELPGLCRDGLVDHGTVRLVWGALLADLNDLIQAHTVTNGGGVGTTFSGIFCHSGRYLVAHVGDSRIYQVGPFTFDQITEDQTLVAREVAEGRLTPEEARSHPKKNVILQSVGTERSLKPAFYEGGYTAQDVFVLCTDGAYRRPGSDGIKMLFQSMDVLDEQALSARCKTIVEQDIVHGEKDNITVACFSTNPGEAGSLLSTALQVEDDTATAVLGAFALADTSLEEEDETPTGILFGSDGDDAPTSIFVGMQDDELPTAIMPDQVAGVAGGEDEA